jgi:hypothetical protein
VTIRRASLHAKTVELQPWELPPPPDARARVIDALSRAARWAPDLGDEVAVAIADLLNNIDRRKKAA